LKDPRIAKFIKALLKRFPGTSVVTGPTPDDPHSGETWIRLLNAPIDPPRLVHDFAFAKEAELWGDEPSMVLVSPIGPQRAAKPRADRVPNKRARGSSRRRRPAASARK
jgi:hypothetical protein